MRFQQYDPYLTVDTSDLGVQSEPLYGNGQSLEHPGMATTIYCHISPPNYRLEELECSGASWFSQACFE
jgi:hypothetical protein